MFLRTAKRGLDTMDSFLQIDDSSISVIAMVVGMLGGYWINGRLQALKAKEARVPARNRRK